MSGGWAGSDRRARLPANWSAIVAQVKRRSKGTCEVYSVSRKRICGRPANGGVDHKDRDGGDGLDNLQDTCFFHHSRKTAAEGNQAKADLKALGRSEPEPHPGSRRRRAT